MKAVVFCAVALLAGVGSAKAQLSVTVYNNDLVLVQDVRTLDVPKGRSRIEFPGVSASIRPETVSISGEGLGVIEQNFDYDLLTPAKMMEKQVGRQVQIVRTNPATGKQTTETATVLSVNSGVVLKIGSRIEVLRDDGLPTRVVFASIPPNLRAQPTLSVTVDADTAGPRRTTLSYLSNGLSWKANYVGLYDEAAGTLGIQGWVTLKNSSGTDFRDADAQLVAGNINTTGGGQDYYGGAARTDSGTGNKQTMGQIADFYSYRLPERMTIADQQTKQVNFLDLHATGASKSYEIVSDRFEGDYQSRHAGVIVRFSNREAALPAGTLRVYMHDDKGERKFVGENAIDHTPTGSDLLVRLGEAFDVTSQATLVSGEKTKNGMRYAMSYRLRNAKSTPVSVDLSQSGLEHDGAVIAESLPSRRLDAHTLDWNVAVPANGETVLTFTVETGT